MINSTSNTYQMKRKISTFTNKISKRLSKPDGYKFEALGIVRDGSESTSTKNVYKKGYHVTEACVLTTSNHPVSIFSRIHSSAEKNYKSANAIF